MANPIKETPALEGADSKKFNADVEERLKEKIPQSDKERILELTKKVLSKKEGDC